MVHMLAVIAGNEQARAFRALGVEAVAVDGSIEARAALHDLAGEGAAVIFIAWDIAEQMRDDIDQYSARPTPAIVSIPTGSSMIPSKEA